LAEPAVQELASRDHSVEIRWRSFELRPEPTPTLDPDSDYLVSAWRNHVYPLAAKLKMDLQRPPIQPHSRLAHEAAKWAEKQGRFEDYHYAVFRAFFGHGKDIGNKEVLKELATDLHLDGKALHVALENNEYTALVLADEEEARRIDVRAVPAFVVNGKVQAAGVQTVERLQELLARVVRH
jgi:predicted DsbA family dithiol-disulfide isomerase